MESSSKNEDKLADAFAEALVVNKKPTVPEEAVSHPGNIATVESHQKGDCIKDKPPTPVDDTLDNYGWDDKTFNLIIKKGDKFLGRYEVERSLGSGTFGRVVRVLDKFEKRYVAIKVIKNTPLVMKQAQIEISLLKKFECFDQKGKYAFVHLQRDFIWRNHVCLVFEVLYQTLYKLLEEGNFKGLSLKITRKFTRQLLEVLDFLSHPKINVMHCDIKPENIMLCNPKSTRIKLIDFGSSCEVSKWGQPYIQSRYYRSPEVLLAVTPYDRAVDIWSLGCTMVEMHIGWPLFPGRHDFDQLSRIMEVLGMPPEHLLLKAEKTSKYFIRDSGYFIPRKIDSCKKSREIGTKTLHDIIGISTGGPQGQNSPNYSPEYANVFKDLASSMLDFNPKTRITPTKALEHKFFLQKAREPTTDQDKSSSSRDIPKHSSLNVGKTKSGKLCRYCR